MLLVLAPLALPSAAAFHYHGTPSVINRSRLMRPRVGQDHRVSAIAASTSSVSQDANPLSSFINNLFGKEPSSGRSSSSPDLPSVADQFVDAWNRRDMEAASHFFSDDATYTDTKFYDSFVGKSALRRHFLLEKGAISPTRARAVDDRSVSADGSSVCIIWHYEEDGVPVDRERGCSFYTVGLDGKIDMAMDVMEPKSKPGDAGLKLLNAASKVIDQTGVGYLEDVQKSGKAAATAVERYFDAWNRRDMENAISCFANDCKYEDTQYADAFAGIEKLETHLNRVAACLPLSFAFSVDDLAISADRRKVGVQWHLENKENGDALPFTRGCSFYKLDMEGLITDGFDVPEPAVVKKGSLELGIGSISNSVRADPIRTLPIAIWVAYMGVVFLSDGILPGANALQLEQRTWEEVRDLSLNFFLVSPLLNLPFSPVVHPMLEGVFNLLLSWAAMFAGFLSDEREDKPNLFPMLPAVAGMQFLTSAFLLPYLALRTSESADTTSVVYKEDLPRIEGILGEFRGLGLLMGTVGSGSILWSLFARSGDFGTRFDERYASFIDLLSIDRVGSSFIVDLGIFAIFQGWLVDDDMRRRGVNVDGEKMAGLRAVAKFVPFFGLAAYLLFRPPLPSRSGSQDRVDPENNK